MEEILRILSLIMLIALMTLSVVGICLNYVLYCDLSLNDEDEYNLQWFIDIVSSGFVVLLVVSVLISFINIFSKFFEFLWKVM